MKKSLVSRPLKVALIHDWLTVYAGAEKVLEQLLLIWPDADLFTTVDFLEEDQRGFLNGKRAKTTFVQSLPFAKRRYRSYLPLMPLAIEQHDLSSYDVVISSSYAVAKGVLTGPDQLHVSYVHSPMRYAWDLQHQYLKESGLSLGVKGMIAKSMLHYLRLWDARTSAGVDEFLANSEFISRRIAKAYRRTSRVIYPPVDIGRFALCLEKQDYYITASRQVPYKRIPLIVEAFARMPDKRLVVVGDGPEADKVKAAAAPNVEVLGYRSTDELVRLMQNARAFVFAAEEDFGIAPVEAQACGTPVIAFGKGGALETILGPDVTHPTGVFFRRQSVEDICEAVNAFEASLDNFDPVACRKNAERFSPERFREQMEALVDEAWGKFNRS
ncbi:glycosyltransferase family 4 protein [Aquincola tertiaricarbonis]|uniref:glycosyltransferase family 4 protein n=1 Tax=Aquincola tertiaricarbonis TaxID=391953 RepID=UPI0035BFBA39